MDKGKSTSRGRRLTPEEADKYRTIRAEVEAERPAVEAEIRSRMVELDELAGIFSELRRIREQQGLSLSDLHTRTGIDRSTLSKLENGQRANFTLDTVVRYADAVGKHVMFALSDKPAS
jgi:predicted transcriptional regulator